MTTLAAARTIAGRLIREVPECPAGIGVAAGQVVAGNVGANERFEYTVIGEPVNEAARLSELAKGANGAPGAGVCGHRRRGVGGRATMLGDGESVTLRGYEQPTRLATLTRLSGSGRWRDNCPPPPGGPGRILRVNDQPIGLRNTLCALTTASSTVPNTTSS